MCRFERCQQGLETACQLSLLLAGVVSSYASERPDGLEYVAGALGFASTARDSATAGSPMADYAVSSLADDPRLSGGLAGVVGVVAVAVVMTTLVLVLRRLPGRR